MVRMEAAADASLAAMRARSKFGIAIAAMIRMIATPISNSINEKPFCFRISFSPLLRYEILVFTDPLADIFALCWPEPWLRKNPGARPQVVHFYGVSSFRHHASNLNLIQIPLFSCQILSSTDKLCHIATRGQATQSRTIRPRRDLAAVGQRSEPTCWC